MKDDTVKNETGRYLAEWFKVIRQAGMAHASHKHIAAFLCEKSDISSWWAQEITVEYEKHIGRRKLGQTQDGLYQIGVSKTIDASAAVLWERLQSQWVISLITSTLNGEEITGDSHTAAAQAGLESLHSLDGESASGIKVHTTIFKAGSHIRMRWQRPHWSTHSVLQIRVLPKSETKTIISFHHEKLPTQRDRQQMQEHWQHVAVLVADGTSKLKRALLTAMETAVREVTQWPKKRAQIFHHNDSDGLASGAILTEAFTRAGFKVKRSCLEKPYPKLLHKILNQSGGLIIFADFAGRIAPLISDLNRSRNLILILDHHAAKASKDPMVHNLDPDLYGLKGDRDISGSTTCYLFAKTLDASNCDLAHIAAIGAVGDEFFVDGCLAGENRNAAAEAVEQGKMEIRKTETGERYYVHTSRGPVACDDLGSYLDTLGAAGYYQNGPDMGIVVCLEGASAGSDGMVKKLQAIQDKAFKDEISEIQSEGLKITPHIQWFHVKNRFAPMGVKMIGLFCDAIKNSKEVDPARYLAGFQLIPNEIPGFGPIELNGVKISMRVSAQMESEIRAGKIMGLDIFLPEATNKLHGFSDACHSLTAATTVAIGMEGKLIEEMEKILQSTAEQK
jgi:hypothetical protein